VKWLPLAAAPALARVGGKAAFWLLRGERRKAHASLARAFPALDERGRDALIAQMWTHLVWLLLELALMDQIDPILETYVELPPASLERYQAAFDRGQGTMFVTAHVGNWELMARRLARIDPRTATIAKESNDPRLTALIEQVRARGRLRTIWRGAPGAARDMLKLLKSGGALGMLIDQDTKVQGVFVRFFGELAHTPRAAADLALRLKTTALVGFVHRRPEGGHRIEVSEVPLPEGLTGEAAVVELTQRLTAAIEATIREAPAEWVWMHQRWKTRPEVTAPTAALPTGPAAPAGPSEGP
jgi:KDO2-lipid IV(A) lauroyltransferase